MPKSLFGRALIILVTPTILIQLIAGAVFYQRHLNTVAKRMAQTVAGDIAYLQEAAAALPDEAARQALFQQARRWMLMDIDYFPKGTLPPPAKPLVVTPLDRAVTETFKQMLPYEHRIEYRPEITNYYIYVKSDRGITRYNVPTRRFSSRTAGTLFWWVLVSTLVVLGVAIMFMRAQLRPIRRLARAADRFGKGREVGDFKPSGAAEVQLAAHAFLDMRDRIERQIRQRTEMLAGVSHDLRTPLTRLKLQLAMMGDAPEIAEMQSDVEIMSSMVEAYLAFARGTQDEEPAETNLGRLLTQVVEEARRQGSAVALNIEGKIVAELRPQALRRCLTNLVDNARRHADRIEVRASRLDDAVVITVDDNGPGIPETARQEVFRPFHRLDAGRNLDMGGVGLGLTIARDAVRSQGGELVLEDAPIGGLRATIRLPQ
jgi:two-component system, OmpR family, osmolarity sensor histidine kinase EnvZ